MFQGLSSSSPIYLFNKKEKKADIGMVVRLENQVDQFGNKVISSGFMTPKIAFVDIVASIQGSEIKFARVPADASVTDSSIDGIILSDNLQDFLDAVKAFKKISEQRLALREPDEETVAKCNAIIEDFDPQKKQEREQAREIEYLKDKISNIESMLTQALNNSSKKEK